MSFLDSTRAFGITLVVSTVIAAAAVAAITQLPVPPEPKIKAFSSDYVLVVAPGPVRFERTDWWFRTPEELAQTEARTSLLRFPK